MLSNILLNCMRMFYTSTTEINQSTCSRLKVAVAVVVAVVVFFHRIKDKGVSNWKNDVS